MGRSGMSGDAVYALFSHFCYVGGFGDLSDPVLPAKLYKAFFMPYLRVFYPIWVLGPGGGGGLPRDWYTTCQCSFSPRAAQKSKFSKLVFLIL